MIIKTYTEPKKKNGRMEKNYTTSIPGKRIMERDAFEVITGA